ncbi:MAG: hypothetical protein MUQ00_13360 [Candidatus Aminicenantes bacterium]|nr:hypothetical protein [Candidatus Aminicenantes bacterium]
MNKTKSTIVVNEGGRELLRLEPSQKKFVESRDPGTTYAPWSRIIYEKNDTVTLKENHDWRFPLQAGQLMLTIINRDGHDIEQFYLSGNTLEPVLAYKNIPRYCCVNIHDPTWAFISKLEIKLVEHTEKNGDYIVRKSVVEKVKTMRSKSEIKAIEKLLVDEAIANAKADFKRRFPSAEL